MKAPKTKSTLTNLYWGPTYFGFFSKPWLFTQSLGISPTSTYFLKALHLVLTTHRLSLWTPNPGLWGFLGPWLWHQTLATLGQRAKNKKPQHWHIVNLQTLLRWKQKWGYILLLIIEGMGSKNLGGKMILRTGLICKGLLKHFCNTLKRRQNFWNESSGV